NSTQRATRRLTQKHQAPDAIEALKRQREALEKRLGDASGKLGSARLAESQEQRNERMQIIEPPSLPQKPVKANRLKMVGIFFAMAALLGLAVSIGPELLSDSIRGRRDLAGVVAGPLIVCIPYITTRADIV